MSSDRGKVRGGSREVDVSRLSAAVAARYIAELREVGSPLLSDPESTRWRSSRADDIVRATLADLGYDGDESESSPYGDDHWRTFRQIAARTFSTSDAMEGTYLLQEIALDVLIRELPDHPVAITNTLSRRLWSDLGRVAAVLQETNAMELATAEVVDRDCAARLLTSRELEVFDLLVEDAPVRRISERLSISEHTVKHHVTNISRKLAAKGRPELMRRAREFGILVAVPVVMLAAAVTDSIVTVDSLV